MLAKLHKEKEERDKVKAEMEKRWLLEKSSVTK
jgi:hypothetical protein